MIKLRQARQSRGWTLEHVAKKIGVTKAAIRDLEIGRRKGSIPVWDALEDLFGIPQRQLREQQSSPDGNQVNSVDS